MVEAIAEEAPEGEVLIGVAIEDLTTPEVATTAEIRPVIDTAAETMVIPVHRGTTRTGIRDKMIVPVVATNAVIHTRTLGIAALQIGNALGPIILHRAVDEIMARVVAAEIIIAGIAVVLAAAEALPVDTMTPAAHPTTNVAMDHRRPAAEVAAVASPVGIGSRIGAAAEDAETGPGSRWDLHGRFLHAVRSVGLP